MPGRQVHRERESPAGDRQLGTRRRLHLSHLEPAEALLETVEKLSRIEILLDVGLAQRHHLPDAFADLEGGLAGRSNHQMPHR
jgi:hypothetical protein